MKPVTVQQELLALQSDFDTKYFLLEAQKQQLVQHREKQILLWKKETEVNINEMRWKCNQSSSWPCLSQVGAPNELEVHKTLTLLVKTLNNQINDKIESIEEKQHELEIQLEHWKHHLTMLASEKVMQKNENEDENGCNDEMGEIGVENKLEKNKNDEMENQEEELDLFCECKILEGEMEHTTRFECYLSKMEIIADKMECWMHKHQALVAAMMVKNNINNNINNNNKDNDCILGKIYQVATKLTSLIDEKVLFFVLVVWFLIHRVCF